MLITEFQLIRKKLKVAKGLEKEETESNKKSSPFLGPNGNPLEDN